MTRLLSLAAFILGALVILWMGVAVAAGHLLASVVMLLIALAYFTGGAELLRYQQATGALHAALEQGGDVELNSWLDALPASLRNPVRQRIEGECVGLPVPVLTPYLVGLLVMLGLMGTFVGMVETLSGAVQALEGSTELSAIRDGLTTPIKGLGMAFGTSVAGVAASAMLGFIATLSRRERIDVSRELDQQRDSRFRNYSLSHQRQQTYSALQQQADALPTVASQLTALSERLGAMGEQLSQQLLDNQQQFQQSVQQDFQSLANAVAESLNRSLADSGRQAGETIKPVVEALLAGLERDLQQRHQQFDEAANARLEAMSSQLEQSAATIDSTWQKGLENQQRANRELADAVGQSLSSSAEQMARDSRQLLDDAAQRSAEALQAQRDAEAERLQQWQAAFANAETMLSAVARSLGEDAETRNAALNSVNQQLLEQQRLQLEEQQAAEQRWQESVAARSTQLIDALQGQLQQLRDEEGQRGDAAVSRLETLQAAIAEQLSQQQAAEQRWQENVAERSSALIDALQGQLQQLRDEEAQRGDAAVSRLETLQAAVATQLAELGNSLEAPLANLIESASEAPRVAAELMEQLRGEITKNIERDNSLLDERRELMSELASLTDGLRDNSQAQREAVEQLLANSGDTLKQLGERLGDSIEQRAGQLAELGDQLAGSALELSGVGDTFAAAVQQFGDSNGELLAALASVEQTLKESGERSDEQMSYYVAQAREIIDHNLLTHQDILARLQALTDSAEQLELNMNAEGAEA